MNFMTSVFSLLHLKNFLDILGLKLRNFLFSLGLFFQEIQLYEVNTGHHIMKFLYICHSYISPLLVNYDVIRLLISWDTANI